MGASPLHRLAQLIGQRDFIDDQLLLDVLGRDGTIVVPMHGGRERRLPSGEILSVLADSAGVPVDQVLKDSFRMNPEEIQAADAFIRLVQFAGDDAAGSGTPAPEQPFQPVDH